MTMSLKEFQRLKKLMASTMSDNDGESLAAIRAANKLLTGNGLSWERVFARTVTVISEMTGNPIASSSKTDEELMFEEALDGTDGTFRQTLLDIYERWQHVSGRSFGGPLNMVDKTEDRAVSSERLYAMCLEWRGIEPENACGDCLGSGYKAYGNTATYRRASIAGQAITNDVCDRCWGSGDRTKPWPARPR